MPTAKTLRTEEDAPVALITGITGQDGGYLAELLLAKGYVVHGLSRNAEALDRNRFRAIAGADAHLRLHNSDLRNFDAVFALIDRVRPCEIYNLAAQTHVHASFEESASTADVNRAGVERLLDAMERLYPSRDVRFFQASSSEIFGNAVGGPQNEQTPFDPTSPYAVSKRDAFEMVVRFRTSLGFFASNGILFNHESPYRGVSFVTRKISQAVAARRLGDDRPLRLGNLDARRDWGHARDYVEAMWMILQHPTPGDYVLASGENHSIREFAETAFGEIGIRIEWQGEGVEEKGLDAETHELLVEVDPAFFRPIDVRETLGDASRARAELGWAPRVSFRSLVREMVNADLERCAGGSHFDTGSEAGRPGAAPEPE